MYVAWIYAYAYIYIYIYTYIYFPNACWFQDIIVRSQYQVFRAYYPCRGHACPFLQDFQCLSAYVPIYHAQSEMTQDDWSSFLLYHVSNYPQSIPNMCYIFGPIFARFNGLTAEDFLHHVFTPWTYSKMYSCVFRDIEKNSHPFYSLVSFSSPAIQCNPEMNII